MPRFPAPLAGRIAICCGSGGSRQRLIFVHPPGVQTGSAFTRESITDLCDQILGYCLCDSREGHPAIFKQ